MVTVRNPRRRGGGYEVYISPPISVRVAQRGATRHGVIFVPLTSTKLFSTVSRMPLDLPSVCGGGLPAISDGGVRLTALIASHDP